MLPCILHQSLYSFTTLAALLTVHDQRSNHAIVIQHKPPALFLGIHFLVPSSLMTFKTVGSLHSILETVTTPICLASTTLLASGAQEFEVLVTLCLTSSHEVLIGLLLEVRMNPQFCHLEWISHCFNRHWHGSSVLPMNDQTWKYNNASLVYRNMPVNSPEIIGATYIPVRGLDVCLKVRLKHLRNREKRGYLGYWLLGVDSLDSAIKYISGGSTKAPYETWHYWWTGIHLGVSCWPLVDLDRLFD